MREVGIFTVLVGTIYKSRLRGGFLLLAGLIGGGMCGDPVAAQEADAAQELVAGFVDLGAARLHYEVAGEGRPVVLIHGGNLDRRMWDEQMAPFAAAFRVIRYDLRPYGRSGPETPGFSHVEDLRRLLDHLEIERADLVGLSLGGRVALDFAVTHPKRVRSMVLAGPGLTGFPWSRDPAMGELMAAAEAGKPKRAVELWLQHAYMAPAMERPALARRVRDIAMQNVRAWSSAPVPERLPDPPTVRRLSEIHTPTLLLLGECDVPDIHQIVERLERELQVVRRVNLAGAGHMLNMEVPAEFNRLVLEFLAGEPEAAASEERGDRGHSSR